MRPVNASPQPSLHEPLARKPAVFQFFGWSPGSWALPCRTAPATGVAPSPEKAAEAAVEEQPRAPALGTNLIQRRALKGRHRTKPLLISTPTFLLALSTLSGLFTSCGYRVVGTADTIPDTVQTIAITTFQNATTEYKIEQHLTASVVREFIARTRYQIVNDPENADATLSGTVLNFLLFPTVFDPRSGRATSISTLTQVHVTLRDRKTGTVLYENPLMQFRERYEVSTIPEAYFEEREAALVRSSQTMARSLVSAVLSGF